MAEGAGGVMRNVEATPLTIPLDKGMDQGTAERASPPTSFRYVENMRIRAAGSLEKRCGTTGVPLNTPGTAYRSLFDTTDTPRPVERPAFIAALGDQCIAASSAGHAFTYERSGQFYDAQQYVGEFSAAQPVRRRLGIAPGLVAQSVGPYMPAVAVDAGGNVVTAAAFGPELRITVETTTGLLIYALTDPAAAATNMVVRVVRASSSGLFFVCYQDIASTAVSYRTVSISNGAASITSAATLVTLANAASTWDLSYYDGTTWFLVYQSGATTVTISERDSSATQTTSVTFSSTDNLTHLSIWADSVTDRVWIGLVDDPTGTPASRFRVYTDALVLSVGPSSFANTGSVPIFGPLYTRTPVAGDAFCVFRTTATTPTRSYLFAAVIQAGTKTREVVQAFNVVPISKPDYQQRVWCMTHGDGSNFEIAKVVLLRFVGDEFLLATNDPTPVVELASPDFEAPGSTYHPYAQPGIAPNAVAVTTESAGGSALFAFPIVAESRTNASSVKEPTHRVDVYEYTRWNQEPHRETAPLGRAGVVAGQPTELWGSLEVVVGTRREHGGVEIGFAHAPTFVSSTLTPNAGGLAAGTYVYHAVQQWEDDEGNLHESAPSAPYSLTLTAPSIVTLQVLNCSLGQRPDRSQTVSTRSPPVVVYRTQNGGTDAQEVPIAPSNPVAGWNGYLEFADTVADSIIDDNEFLYTGGGVLPNVLAPSCRYIAVSEERLWCGGLWDSNIIECSKLRVPGEPYNFTGDASHQVVIPGEVSGLAYMDGQLCVFTEDLAIYLVSGDGPNDQGAGGFPPPRLLARGVGCQRDQAASILETELGIIFRSPLGYYVIPRGFGTPQLIGSPVQDEPEVVLSAATTTTAEHRLARFLVADAGETKSERVLVFDLVHQQWFRDTYVVDGASITGQGFSEIGEWPEGLALLSYGLQRTDNPKVIWAENEDLTGDEGADAVGASQFISIDIQTPWIYPGGNPLGWARATKAMIAMQAIGSSQNVTLTVQTDGNTAQAATWAITTAESLSLRQMSIKEPSCSAFQIRIQDAVGSAGATRGVRLLSLVVEAKPEPGVRPMAAAECA